MRRANRRDTTHAPMVADLRKMGISVLDLSQVGKGCPDLLCCLHKDSLLVEVKSPKKVRGRKGDGLSDAQVKFRDSWQGCPVIRAEVAETVLNAFIQYHRI